MKVASLWVQEKNDSVRCEVCGFCCRLVSGQTGLCGVRANNQGRLVSLVYGRAAARSVDPIEKKPFYHLRPGSRWLSLGTVGCNLRCSFCSNSEISQKPRGGRGIIGEFFSSLQIVQEANRQRCAGICFTFNEPTVAFEYVIDTAYRARELGLQTILCTNGFLTRQAISCLAPLINAVKVDIKGASESQARKISGVSWTTSWKAIERFAASGVWVEISSVIIPEMSNSFTAIMDISKNIKTRVGTDTPLHLLRFFPSFLLSHYPPLDIAYLEELREAALTNGLHYVYLSNIPGHPANHTRCPGCGRILINRSSHSPQRFFLSTPNCPSCGTTISGIDLCNGEYNNE